MRFTDHNVLQIAKQFKRCSLTSLCMLHNLCIQANISEYKTE